MSAMTKKYTVADVTHPFYDEKFRDWLKWRYTYEGGQRFIDQYLQQYTLRESAPMFDKRKRMTYNPAFAKQAVDEVKNALFQRIVDVVRYEGSPSYDAAINGTDGGVDMVGNSMASFIGTKILPELLPMSRVGVFVDMPQISGVSVADTNGKRPYVYVYQVEDIRSWTIDETNSENEFTNILLRDYIFSYDDKTGLPTGTQSRFRRMWLEDGSVRIQFYNDAGTEIDRAGSETANSIITLDIPRIPFILVKLSDSLLADVANYQVALLNLSSSDLSYALQANFPFYTEQFDPRSETGGMFTRRAGKDQGGESTDGPAGKVEEIKVGITTGRRYPRGLERPEFIHPSSEPLVASMNKQEQLKSEIRALINLSLTNLQPQKQSSAAVKKMDNAGLESGLSYIGLELENMERKIATYWQMYEKGSQAAVYYPETYSLKTEAERRLEAKEYSELLPKITSVTGRREIIKHICCLLLARKVTAEDLDKIQAEVEDAKGTSADSVVINADVIGGFLDLDTAATLSGYPAGTAKKAADDHAERLKRIAETQTPGNGMVNGAARGSTDTGADANAGKKEKVTAADPTTKKTAGDQTRGKGK